MVIIKSDEEIAIMKEGGRRHAAILQELRKMVRPGITTLELDRAAEELVRVGGDIPAFKGYKPLGANSPFPATLCTSVNEEIVHGIPGNRKLEIGDIVKIDLGLRHRGLYTDGAITVPVGEVSHEVAELIAATEEALQVGIAAAQPGATTGDVGAAIKEYIDGRYGIIRDLAGHGVGRHIHEDPFIPNYGTRGTGEVLEPGMTIAIEPMLSLGKHHMKTLKDGWTIVTKDKSFAAHVEHTVAITPEGPVVLTHVEE